MPSNSDSPYIFDQALFANHTPPPEKKRFNIHLLESYIPYSSVVSSNPPTFHKSLVSIAAGTFQLAIAQGSAPTGGVGQRSGCSLPPFGGVGFRGYLVPLKDEDRMVPHSPWVC